ncbi:hypothetical protein MMC17_000441 [Xylographa soralifera]|nr:hypothetical protein [Xylographa soralifera]
MATAKDGLIDLARPRKQLEDDVARLFKFLQHWQTWEAEYEGLKEEILGLGKDPPIQNLKDLGVDFGGVLLTEPEIKRLLEDAGGQQRSAGQVLGLLSRRVDYVQDNVKTLIKQLTIAEDKLEAIDVSIHPEARSEEGLPLTEITEELDEDGNVISSSITTPGDSSKQVVEALRKAGVKDLPIPSPPKVDTPYSAGESTSLGLSRPPDTAYRPKKSKKTEKRKSNLPDSSLSSGETFQLQRKKVVSFAQEAKVDVLKSQTRSHLNTTKKPSTSTTSYNENLPHDTTPGKAEIVPDIQDADDAHEYIDSVPAEAAEDAALRRQMLQYSVNEVGAIVAEMDLEESDSMTDYSEDTDEEYGSEADEEEDQYGRTTRRVISDDYRRQMLELERKLNAKVLENVGPNPEIPALENVSCGTVSVEVNPQEETSSSMKPNKPKPKKGVRFAESLDISEVSPRTVSSRPPTDMSSASTPIADLVVERAPSNTAKPSTKAPKKRQSKFKIAQQDRNPNPANQNNPTNNSSTDTTNLAPPPPESSQRPLSRQVPTGPPGLTHAATLIERPSAPSSAEAPPPDEFDPALMQQSLTTEYHRMRNRMIQRSGGFLANEDEPATTPLEDASQPPGKRVSLFKRARLG